MTEITKSQNNKYITRYHKDLSGENGIHTLKKCDSYKIVSINKINENGDEEELYRYREHVNRPNEIKTFININNIEYFIGTSGTNRFYFNCDTKNIYNDKADEVKWFYIRDISPNRKYIIVNCYINQDSNDYEFIYDVSNLDTNGPIRKYFNAPRIYNLNYCHIKFTLDNRIELYYYEAYDKEIKIGEYDIIEIGSFSLLKLTNFNNKN